MAAIGGGMAWRREMRKSKSGISAWAPSDMAYG